MSSGGGVNVLEGRAFARNVMFRGNIFRLMHGWDREAFTSDGGGGYYFGPAQPVSARQLRLNGGEFNARYLKVVKDWRGAGVFILCGRGRGQWARVAAIDNEVVTIDRDLATLPDDSSVISITQLQENLLLIDNKFEDVGSGIQYYGTSINNVAAGNRAERSSGFLASGRWYRHYQPSCTANFWTMTFGTAMSSVADLMGCCGTPKPL